MSGESFMNTEKAVLHTQPGQDKNEDMSQEFDEEEKDNDQGSFSKEAFFSEKDSDKLEND
jgi:hypothetical protein